MQICFDLHVYLLNLKYYDIKTCQVLIKNANSCGFLFRPKIIENILKMISEELVLSQDLRVSKRIFDILNGFKG